MSILRVILFCNFIYKQYKINYNIKGNKQEDPLPPVQNPAFGTDL